MGGGGGVQYLWLKITWCNAVTDGGGGGGYLQNFQKNHLIGMVSHHLVLDAPRQTIFNS